MDIEKIEDKKEPDYPTLNNHRVNRRSMLKTIVGGLAVAGLVGCKEKERPQAAGSSCCPAPPEKPGPAPETPAHTEIRGRMPAPKAPEQPRTAGEIAAPKAPDHPKKAGSISVAAPGSPDEPRIAGGMPAPKKDGKHIHEHPPAIGGAMVAPEPPKK